MLSAVILAAGQSKRIGRDKLLLNLADETILEIFLKKLPLDRFYKVNLVYNNEKIREIAEKFGINCIFIDEPARGQGYSIKNGLQNIDTDVMFFAADMPLVETATIEKLIEMHINGEITAPYCKNMRRNPIIFPQEAIHSLQSLKGDVGGRVIVESGEFMVNRVDFDDCSQFMDIDSEEDYETVKKLWQKDR